jgi:hypothetical protein
MQSFLIEERLALVEDIEVGSVSQTVVCCRLDCLRRSVIDVSLVGVAPARGEES